MALTGNQEQGIRTSRIPLYIFAGMAFSLNVIYLVTMLFKTQLSIGAFWSIGLLLSLVLFIVVWFTERKVLTRAAVAYLLVNLVIFALDLVSFYVFHSDYFPGLLHKLFSPGFADFLVRLLSGLK